MGFVFLGFGVLLVWFLGYGWGLAVKCWCSLDPGFGGGVCFGGEGG